MPNEADEIGAPPPPPRPRPDCECDGYPGHRVCGCWQQRPET